MPFKHCWWQNEKSGNQISTEQNVKHMTKICHLCLFNVWTWGMLRPPHRSTHTWCFCLQPFSIFSVTSDNVSRHDLFTRSVTITLCRILFLSINKLFPREAIIKTFFFLNWHFFFQISGVFSQVSFFAHWNALYDLTSHMSSWRPCWASLESHGNRWSSKGNWDGTKFGPVFRNGRGQLPKLLLV